MLYLYCVVFAYIPLVCRHGNSIIIKSKRVCKSCIGHTESIDNVNSFDSLLT